MAGKHAPRRLDRYLAIHAKWMSRLRDAGFVQDDGIAVVPVARGYLLSGRIRCLGGICVDVRKVLGVVSGVGATAMVRTVEYTYHAVIEDVGNVLRYCSPHDDEAHPEHRPFHHKHHYDVLKGDVIGAVSNLSEEEWPRLGEVLHELRGWYYANHEAIEAARRKP